MTATDPDPEISPDVLAVREQYEARILGLHMPATVRQAADKYGDQPAFSDRFDVPEGATWSTISWAETWELTQQVAAALIALGVERGDPVAIMAANRTAHTLADYGAMTAAAVPMSIYNTLAQDQVAFIAGESRPVVVVLEDHDRYQRWEKALDEVDSIRHVVMLADADRVDDARAMTWEDFLAHGRDTSGVEERMERITPDLPATFLYTSGTTGNPKGVVLTHHNVMYEAVSTLDAAGLHGPQRTISYLPLAHIAERVLATYAPPFLGSHVHAIPDPAGLLGALGEVHPTAFFGVPRVWEKIKTGISAKLAEDPDPANQELVTNAMAAGLAWTQAHEYGNEMTPEVEEAYNKADEAILGFLRLLLGLDQVQWAASAAAPMPLEVAKFMGGLGLQVYDVYGMTETTGAFTSNGPGAFKLGTVGRPNPGIEVRLAEDGEILCRGPVNTPGYHLQEQATRNLIDEDGWIHTGDIGTLDEDGFYSIIDRKKELIITSSGKNIAPSNIENYLKESPIIGHAMALGDDRSYVVAILTLDGEIAPLVAAKMGIEFTDLADLSTKAEIRAMAQAAVDKANERLSRPEQVKAWELLADEWTAESEELTPTLKLKRRVVRTKYADVVDKLYE
ncbi:long-chain acyl-CoA synthetase [Nocardioides flavus (ex Wang et al. 2016)]|uniref:Acyl-CoA synthetase n=1 Tax=Nocardioides flavus (ex Wang et al. 2016) TaxID=2058780 RepID=A0ABQ3HJH0_9ACTN|nr:AMP-dependent synthetase/ligase [Nocardioides flavus (ex Wang et al. 2016)]GHE17065.1 long-chain acyl-CoA synthetase [Nocardioides flavus (ex Wang et al. 2016)]